MQIRRSIGQVAALAIAGGLSLTALLCGAQAPVAAPQAPTKAAATTSPALIAQGKTAYSGLDCSDCHVLSAAGKAMGPELTHIGATLTQSILITAIRHPKKVTPTGWMPAYPKTKISTKQLNALSAYLASLK
jgi:cytochrome c1